ncbi:MAG: 3-hydroxybutyryl-CoA dehydrogenase [Bacteroidia bacterium]|nr:3-hydroxybutyryl-CoA dehydrogenase [Bacteroidia bacterium]
MNLEQIGIIGAGTMGRGIAQVASTAGHKVILFDLHESVIQDAQQSHTKILDRLIEKGRIDENEKNRILGNIEYTANFNLLSDSEIVIEAIVENLDIKHKVFKQLESQVSESCIIASNTSSLSITSLAASLDNPGRFIGIHFFNPAPLMKLVEIIPAIQTSIGVTDKATNLIQSWNKTTVQAKDTPGFIVNKVARPFYSEAIRIYEEGIADFSTIDDAMKSMAGFRMGPFQLMDFIGHDVNYTVTETVWEAFYYDPRYKPSFTQKRLKEAGFLGRKSGRGFYDYNQENPVPPPSEDENLKKYIANRIIMMLINEAADTLHSRIASKEDIDLAMTKGVNYPNGLLAWADEIGIQVCVESIDALYNDYHEDRYRCSPVLRMMAKQDQKFF